MIRDDITGTLLFTDHGQRMGLDNRHIVGIFGYIGVPARQVDLFVRQNEQRIIRGSAAMLTLSLTGESIPLPPEHVGQSMDYLACQRIWRMP